MNGGTSIVFLIADDHRCESLGSSGNRDVRTPVLDALAESGAAMQGTRIFGGMTGAVCAPSRACVMTGQSIFRSMIGCDPSVWAHSTDIREEAPLLPERLRAAGYRTHAVGKWHNDKRSFARSFDGGDKLFFYGMSDHWRVPVQPFDPSGLYGKERERIEERHSTELFTDAAIEFLEKQDGSSPFFLYVAYTAPHDPRTAPEPYASLFDPERLRLPPNLLPEHPFDNGDMGVRDERLASLPRQEAELRRHLADYYAMLAHLDAQVGRIVECLKSRGMYESTLLVYTADHGLSIGQHGLMGKQNVYEHSVRIPLLLRGPGIVPGRKLEALLSNIDIAPTVAELAGLPEWPEADGISFASLLREPAGGAVSEAEAATRAEAAGRDHVCTAYQDLQRMVTDGRWKLIRYYRRESDGVGTDRLQLFDLQADPWETRDVGSDPDQLPVLLRLARMLESWMTRHGDPLSRVPILNIIAPGGNENHEDI
ncbi:sulfatase-like hydrolase/transferase [Cohnella fermenti]|uniref:Sulfatase n=1 Tax=Cohnella fermenti TaxID=2565925 RepID=A0A4S4C9U2_9BACL|nr:sulfatase-like hydrolase/transferase [Cohnella fermenti]THF84517.1 sulfatase [Cohnella fermenti]